MFLFDWIFEQTDLDPAFYETWNQEYREALNSVHLSEERLLAVAEKIEQNLELIGASAIEDKLQDGVPDSISRLLEAGIKVWMLTGDKLETAINIGMCACSCIIVQLPFGHHSDLLFFCVSLPFRLFLLSGHSCHLITPSMEILRINESSQFRISNVLAGYFKTYQKLLNTGSHFICSQLTSSSFSLPAPSISVSFSF